LGAERIGWRILVAMTTSSRSAKSFSGLDPSDVLLLMSFLWRTADDEAGRAQAARTLDLVLSGLRSGGE
jgi:hypothetical protein